MPLGARHVPSTRGPFGPRSLGPVLPPSVAVAATKLYLHSAASSLSGPSTQQSAANVETAGNVAGAMTHSADQTPGVAQASVAQSLTGTNGRSLFGGFRLARLADQTIPAGSWVMSWAASRGSSLPTMGFAFSIYVWRPSTASVVGYVYDSTAATNVTTTAGVEQALSAVLAGSSLVVQSGDILVLEVWGTISSGTQTSTFFYDGTTEGSTASNAANLVAPAPLLLSASTPVSNSLDFPIEALGSVTLAPDLPLEAVAAAIAATVAPIESTLGLAAAATVPVEATQGVPAVASAPLEVAQALAQAQLLPVESTGTAAATASEPLEATGAVAPATVQGPVEATGAIAAVAVAVAEALGGVANLAASAVEALQGLVQAAVAAVESSLGVVTSSSESVEAGQGVAASLSDPVEAAGAVASTGAVPVESAAAVAASASDPIEALQTAATPVSQTAELAIEAASAIAATADAPGEATGGVSAAPALPLDAVQPVAAAAAAPVEAGQDVGAQQAELPLDVLGALLSTGALPIEAIGLAPIPPPPDTGGSGTVGDVGGPRISEPLRLGDRHLDDDEELLRVLDLLGLL